MNPNKLSLVNPNKLSLVNPNKLSLVKLEYVLIMLESSPSAFDISNKSEPENFEAIAVSILGSSLINPNLFLATVNSLAVYPAPFFL